MHDFDYGFDWLETMDALPNCPWKRFADLWSYACGRLARTAPRRSKAVQRAEHSLAVARIVHDFAKDQMWPRWKRDTAIAAALLHDVEKFSFSSWHEVAAEGFIMRNADELEELLPEKCAVDFGKVADAVFLHRSKWKPWLTEMLEEDDLDAFDIAVILRAADKLSHAGREEKALKVFGDALAVLEKSPQFGFMFFLHYRSVWCNFALERLPS